MKNFKIIFQPEIRKFLGYLGQSNIFHTHFNKKNPKEQRVNVVKELIESVKYLSFKLEVVGEDASLRRQAFLQKSLAKKLKTLDLCRQYFVWDRGEHDRAEQGPAGAIPLSRKVFGKFENLFSKRFSRNS